MISSIRIILGFDLELRTVFAAPTVAQLTQRLFEAKNTQEDAFSVLVPLKPHGIRPPLFCVHPISGLSWSFIGLSIHLPKDQPLYGLQARGFDGKGQLAETLEDMARDCIDQIQRIQPEGPYHLLGWSFGGSVAHSMAVQLERMGEKVALLALMDSITDYSTLKDDVAKEHENHMDRSREQDTPEESKALWDKAHHVILNNIRLARNFTPSVFSGDMVYFRATVQPDESTPLPDPRCWLPFIRGKFEMHDVECKHLDMNQPKSMAKIGSVLFTKFEEWRQ
ncbi:hypothetical protein BGZ54_004396 [Gamsiella multidivaricata]|nr:hypothetical protein BGZ54_004396 [Gamsiella multidivaricata]